MDKDFICFHHIDMDGKCSGAIVKKAIPNVELYGINYGDEFPWDKIKGRPVIMVDFSLPFIEMVRLRDESASLIWIDHHKNSIDEYNKHSNTQIPGLLLTKFAACELTWKWFFSENTIPKAVRLLGRYDVWDHTDEEAVPFEYGMRLHEWEAGDSAWDCVLGTNEEQEDVVHSIILDGELVLAYEKQQNIIYAKNSYELQFEGLRAIVCNHGPAGSALFESVYNPAKHDIMIAFHQLKDKRWKFSLRSTKPEIDCNELAKKYGGGGHPGAAGFIVPESNYNPFWMFTN